MNMVPIEFAGYVGLLGIALGYVWRAAREQKSSQVRWPDGTALRHAQDPAPDFGVWQPGAVPLLVDDATVYSNIDEYRLARQGRAGVA